MGCLVEMMLALTHLCLPCLTDPDRGQVTRLEAEATIPPVASPKPILIVSLQEEQDKCKGTVEVQPAPREEYSELGPNSTHLLPASFQLTAWIC